MISLEEYLEDGGWEGEAREEWRKEFLESIDTSKDGFLDRAEVIATVPPFLFAELSFKILSKDQVLWVQIFEGVYVAETAA